MSNNLILHDLSPELTDGVKKVCSHDLRPQIVVIQLTAAQLLFEMRFKQNVIANQPGDEERLAVRAIHVIKIEIQSGLSHKAYDHEPVSENASAQAFQSETVCKVTIIQKEKNDKSQNPCILKKKVFKSKNKSRLPIKLRFIVPFLFGICEAVVVIDTLSQASLSTIVVFFVSKLASIFKWVINSSSKSFRKDRTSDLKQAGK